MLTYFCEYVRSLIIGREKNKRTKGIKQDEEKHYEMYNRSERKQVFASYSKFRIENVRKQVTYSK